MGMDYLEITVTGTVETRKTELVLKVSGTAEEFFLGEAPTAKGVLDRLREAVARGDPIKAVVGRVPGWSGRFPDVLKKLASTSPAERRMLLVRDFEMAPKKD